MSEYGLRLHPIIILENTIRTAIALLVLLLVVGGPLDRPELAAAIGLSLVALLLFYYRQWKLTFIRFGQTDLVVERRTLFKLKKTIPYSRIASVNLNRGVLNRLSGTSKLMVNINSGYNAIRPEASLTFGHRFADVVRDDLSRRLRDDIPSPSEDMEGAVRFSTMDVILHGLFSVPTQQSILGTIFLIYSIVQQYRSTVSELETGSGGAVFSLLLFFGFMIFPAIRHMIYYYGFKAHRQGDTIFLEHGLIRTYKTSFHISRVNAVRTKTTLISRLLRRSYIEAEVVGIGSAEGGGNSRPLISLLANDEVSRHILWELVPEFIYEMDAERQPIGARNLLIMKGAIASIVLAVLMAYPAFVAYRELTPEGGSPIDAFLPYAMPSIFALAVAAISYSIYTSLRVRKLDMGEELFTFINGILDRETVVMSYDKVQMVHVIRGPLARLFGVSTGKVFMLSSMGTSSITSGSFPEDRLERIGEKIMARATLTGR